MRRIVIVVFSLIVLGILFVVLCTFVRRPYEVVLIDRFGKVIECSDATMQTHPPMMYHWYFKYPTDRIIPVDTRLHLVQTPLQQVVTKGSEPISIRTFVAWRIVDPVKFYNTIAGSDEQAQAVIDRKISGLVQAKVAAHELDELFSIIPGNVHMAQMESVIATEATNGSTDKSLATPLSGVKEQGLQVVQVGFSRMAFPPSNAQAVYDRMSAERKLQSDAFVAEGRSLANQEIAQGDAQAAQIRGAAVKEAETIRGQGDQEANQILASVQQSKSARDFYQYWKSLDFVKGAFNKNTYIVLPTDSDWLHALFNAPKNTQSFLHMDKPEQATTLPATTLPAMRLPDTALPSLKLMEPVLPTTK